MSLKINNWQKTALAGLLLASFQAGAATIPWVGTADYTAAPSATGDEDAAVGLFDTYDFGTGAAVIDDVAGAVEGDELTGSYQSFVTAHELNSAGGGVADAANLNTGGAGGTGTGYEVTVAADFTETITAVNGSTVEFAITGGSFDLWFDTSPDFDFNADTGFTSDDAILSGTIVGGAGTLIGSVLVGVTTIDIRVDAFDADVFDPATIVAGNSVFTLQLSNSTTAAFLAGIENGANSVNGNTVGGNDLLLAADGNLALQAAVPVPAAVWLFATGLLGLAGVARRRK